MTPRVRIQQLFKGITDAPPGTDAQLWAQAWAMSVIHGNTQQWQYTNLLNDEAGGSIYMQQAKPGFPSTFTAISIWSRSGSIHAPWAPNNIENDAVANHDGWIKTDTGSVIQLTDPRYTKMQDGHWENRNHPGVNLGYAVAVSSQPPASAIEKAEASFTSGASTAVQDAGSGNASSSLPAIVKGSSNAAGDIAAGLSGPIADIAEAIWNFIKEVGADAEDLLKAMGFLLQCAEKIVTGQLSQLDPFRSGTLVYNFINDASNEGPLTMLIIVIVLGPLALFLAPLYAAFSQSNPFTGSAVRAVVQALRDLTTGVASGQSMFEIGVKIVQDVVLGVVGVPVGPATAVKIVYLVLSGLPIPPIMAIADAILADPVAQAAVGNALPFAKPVVDEWMPLVMSCLNASDAGQWLTCVTGVVEQLFPNVVRGLQSFAIDVNDLRTVIQSAWETGGDISLMLSNVASASGVFSAASSGVTPVQGAMIGIGFFGVGYIMKSLGIDGAETFFVDVLLPLLPSAVRTAVSSAYDVFRFIEQLIIEAGNARAQLTTSQSPTGFVLYLLEAFHDAQWDVEIAVTQLIADEFDPNQRTTRLISSNLKRDASGHFIVSSALKALWTKLELDFPRLKYQLAMLAAHLGISDGELLGTRADIDSQRASLKISVPSMPQSITYVKGGPVALSPNKATASTSSGAPETSLNTGSGNAGNSMVASVAAGSGLGGTLALMAGAAAAGAAAGGLPGALAGAAAGLLFDAETGK